MITCKVWDYVSHSNDVDFQKKVEGLLLYHKVVSVRKLDSEELDKNQVAELVLDNGVVLKVEGNEGCGGCGNGWFYLTELNNCDNAITKVECVIKDDEGNIVSSPSEKYDGSGDFIYNIFVFAENNKINLLQYEGGDNGYYGTGYSLYVSLFYEAI